MTFTRLTTAKKAGFSGKIMRRRKDPPKLVSTYMKQKSSFLIAALSLVAFITGNMVGEHGWYAFWKAALGNSNDSLITYTGTVPPIVFVPDNAKWALYGGNPYQDLYQQIPQNLLLPLPPYNESYEKTKPADTTSDIYATAYLGSYTTGREGDGSHPGVDIDIPLDTPIRSIANGVVQSVSNDAYGFGLYVVIRHPNVPNPDDPSTTTTLYSVYAHLNSQLVTVGETVTKGEEIGLSGSTGNSTGPHLYFQIDKNNAPYHPYWPFTGADLRAAGLTENQAISAAFHQSNVPLYTVNPMLYVQANYPSPSDAPTTVATTSQPLTLSQFAAQRRAERLAALGLSAPTYVPTITVATTVQTSSRSAAVVQKTTVVSDTQSPSTLSPAPVIVAPSSAPAAPINKPVSTINIESARQYTNSAWQTIRLTLLDANGATTSSTQGLPSAIYLKTAYGSAEFSPAIVKPSDFVNGTMTVKMLGLGSKTIVPELQPMGIMGDPILYSR